MYLTVLTVHSWLRWVALIAGLVTTVMLVTGQSGRQASGRSATLGLVCMITLDLQLLLGLLLYFGLSPTLRAVQGDFGAAMRDPVARFWTVEHLVLMLAAVALAHVGRMLARKASTDSSRRNRLLICFGLATILMLIGIPWPGMRGGRPLFRI
jgi:hypothetical protein